MLKFMKCVLIEQVENICENLTYKRNKLKRVHNYIKIEDCYMDRVRKLYQEEGFTIYNDEICRLVLATAIEHNKSVNELMNLDNEKLFDVLIFNTARAIVDSSILFELSSREDDIESFTKHMLYLYNGRMKDVKIQNFDDYDKKLVVKLIQIYKEKGIDIYEAEAFAAWENYSDLEYDASFLRYESYTDEELFKATIKYMLQSSIELKYDERINILREF